MPVPQNQGGTGILPVAAMMNRLSGLFHNQEFSCPTGILPVAAMMNRQDACSTIKNFLVQQASCLLRTQAQHLPR